MRNEKVYKLTLTALMAALSYVVFTFCRLRLHFRVVTLLPCILEMQSVY